MPDFSFQTYYYPQTPDSNATNTARLSPEQTIENQAKQDTSSLSAKAKVQENLKEEPAIVSIYAGNPIDSAEWRLMVAQYRKRRIKAHKIIDSPILIRKEHFWFLKSEQNPPLSLYRITINKRAIHPESIKKSKPTEKTNFKKEVKDSTNRISHQILSSIKTEELPKQSLNSEIKTEPPIKNNEPHNNLKSNWGFLGFLLILLFYVAFIKLKFNNKLKQYPKALFNYHLFYRMFQEQNTNSNRLSALLSVLFTINSSILLFYLGIKPIVTSTNYGIILISIISAVSIYYLAFVLINKLIAFIYEDKKILKEYLYNFHFINRFFGVLSIPFVIIYPFLASPFSTSVLYLAIILYLILYIYHWLRGTYISFKNNVPIFYMILYLCILEIVPVILLYKWLF